MKATRVFVVMLAMFATAASANGEAEVWFQTSTAGGQGEILELAMGAGDSEVIEAWVATGSRGLAGWGFDLIAPDGAIGLTASAWSNNGSSPWGTNSNPFTVGPAPDLELGASQIDSGGVASVGTYKLATFTLTSDGTVSDNYVDLRVNSGEFLSDYYYGYPQYYQVEISVGGGNPFVGAPGASASGIHVTPEPATLALLGLAGLALIRRRR